MLLSRGVGRWRLCSDPTTTAITAEREVGREGRKWSVEGADGTEFLQTSTCTSWNGHSVSERNAGSWRKKDSVVGPWVTGRRHIVASPWNREWIATDVVGLKGRLTLWQTPQVYLYKMSLAFLCNHHSRSRLESRGLNYSSRGLDYSFFYTVFILHGLPFIAYALVSYVQWFALQSKNIQSTHIARIAYHKKLKVDHYRTIHECICIPRDLLTTQTIIFSNDTSPTPPRTSVRRFTSFRKDVEVLERLNFWKNPPSLF